MKKMKNRKNCKIYERKVDFIEKKTFIEKKFLYRRTNLENKTFFLNFLFFFKSLVFGSPPQKKYSPLSQTAI